MKSRLPFSFADHKGEYGTLSQYILDFTEKRMVLSGLNPHLVGKAPIWITKEFKPNYNK
jgi:hypothetical protein